MPSLPGTKAGMHYNSLPNFVLVRDTV